MRPAASCEWSVDAARSVAEERRRCVLPGAALDDPACHAGCADVVVAGGATRVRVRCARGSRGVPALRSRSSSSTTPPARSPRRQLFAAVVAAVERGRRRRRSRRFPSPTR